MKTFAALLSISALAVSADVVPHCGGPKVEVQRPGQECGAHGPRWRGECSAPAACFLVDSGGAKCTAACETDADCLTLGANFTCSDRGKPYTRASDPNAKVCGAKRN